MAEDGVQIPFSIETGNSEVTIEKLAANILELNDSVRKLQESTKKAGEATKESAVQFGAIAGFVGAITAKITDRGLKALDDFTGGLERATAFGSQFQNMSLQFNTSAESLQKLAAQGKPVGVGVEQIARSLNIVERTLGSNQAAFRKWGINVQELAGKDAAGKFDILINKIRSIDDPARQAAASFELLKDRSGAFLKIARSGEAKEIAEDFKNFGLAVSDNAVGALDQLGNRKDLIHDIFSSMERNIFGAVASSGALQTAIRVLTEWIGQLGKWVQDNADTIRKWVDTAILAAADALVFLAKTVFPVVIDALTVFALGIYNAKKAVDFLIASLKLQFDLLTKPFSVNESIDAFKKRIAEIAQETLNGNKAILDRNRALQDSAGQAAIALEKARKRIEEGALAHTNYAAAAKKSSGAFVGEPTEAAIKQIIKGLEDELALFQKVQALEKLGFTFANTEEQQVQAARAAQAAADKELVIRTKILEEQRKLLELKGEETKSIDQQLVTLQKTHDVNVAIARVQEQQAKLAAETARKLEDIGNAQKLTSSTIELSHAQDDVLQGQVAANAQRQKALQLEEASFEAERAKLLVQIQQRIIAGNMTDDLIRQLAQITKEHDLRVANLEVLKGSERSMISILKQQLDVALAAEGWKNQLVGVVGVMDSVAGSITGLVDQAKQFGQALQVGGSIANRAFAAAKAGGSIGESIGGLVGGPIGAAIGKVGGTIVGGLIGALHKPAWQKAGEEAGKILGIKVSEALAKEIEASAKKLGISIKNATLLSLPKAIEESGKKAHDFAGQILDLENAIASGAVPAEQGIAALGDTFTKVADEALRAGKVGDRTLVSLIKRARELKIDSPEIKAFVGQQLDASTAGVSKFIDSLKVLSGEAVAKLGKDAGTIFGANFAALVEEKGIVAAVDAMQESFTSLKDALTKSLGEEGAAQILAPFAAAFDTIGNEKLKPIFEGIDGITQAMKGLANAGFLTVDQFSAMQHATKTLFDEAIAGGADTKTALQAIAPSIQAAIKAAEQFGVPLDGDTQRLKELAEQNGITFATDPQQAMLDVLVEIAKVLGADIPESAMRAKKSIQDLADTNLQVPEVGGGGVTGGTGGRKSVTANVQVNLGINENPLAAADTAAAMRKQTIEWTAEAIQDRVPAIVAALEAAG